MYCRIIKGENYDVAEEKLVLVTNLNQMVGEVLRTNRLSREQFADIVGVSQSSLSRTLHNDVLTRNLIAGLDAIGYDIEVRCVRKDKEAWE